MKPYDDPADKGAQVRAMFDNVAHRYDRLNHILSLGIDRLWRRRLGRIVARGRPRAILDLATGTGDMAIALARRIPGAHITGVDVSGGMLAIGRAKVARARLGGRIDLVEGAAEALPLPDNNFDAATAVFGVRNFSDIEKGLGEMHRVLRPKGMAYVMEFSTPRVRIFSYLYRWYFHRVVPAVGGWISGDRRAYAYLPASVDEFPAPERFLEMMRRAGFGDCRAKNVFFGVAKIYIGKKQ